MQLLMEQTQMDRYKIKWISAFNFLLCSTLLSVGVVQADSNTNLEQPELLAQSFNNCLKIVKDSARLSCFDQLASLAVITKDSAKQAVSVSEETVIKAAQKTQKQKIDEFAIKQVELTKEEQREKSAQELTEFSATITSLKKLLRGEWVVTLDNGQKWQQKSSGKIKLKVDDIIVIKKGALGAIYLKKKGSSRNIKVKRIR